MASSNTVIFFAKNIYKFYRICRSYRLHLGNVPCSVFLAKLFAKFDQLHQLNRFLSFSFSTAMQKLSDFLDYQTDISLASEFMNGTESVAPCLCDMQTQDILSYTEQRHQLLSDIHLIIN